MQALLTFKRINRTEFIAWSNLSALLSLTVAYLLTPYAVSLTETLNEKSPWLGYLSLYLFYISVFFLPLKLLAQRYRDAGITGWAALVGLIPLSYLLLYLLMAIFPGEKSANKYGDAPNNPKKRLSLFAIFSQLIMLIVIISATLFN